MKKAFHLVLLFVFGMFCSSTALANDKVLDSRQVAKLLMGNTLTVVEEDVDRKTGQRNRVQVFFSEDGFARVSRTDGDLSGYSWKIREDGSFCWQRHMGKRGRGANCGFFYSPRSRVFELYKVRSTKKSDGEIVRYNRAKKIFTIEKIVKGNTLY